MQKFKENYETDKYVSLKNRMKEYNKKAQKLIQMHNEKQQNEGPAPVEPSNIRRSVTTIPRMPPSRQAQTFEMKSSEDLNFDVGAFIASVAEEAMNKDIVSIFVFPN
jgi:hypothetical protein